MKNKTKLLTEIFSVLLIIGIFLSPSTASAIVDLGQIDNLYFADRVATSWDLESLGLDDDTKISAYFSNRGKTTKILVDDNKKIEDEINFIIYSSLPETDYRIEIMETGRPYHVLAATGWFKVLGKKPSGTDEGVHFNYNINKFRLGTDSEIKFRQLFVENKSNRLRVEWRTYEDAKIDIWATCEHEIFLRNKEDDISYLCPENGREVKVHSFDEYKRLGGITFYPEEVTYSTDVIFSARAVDEDDLVIGEKKKTARFLSEKNVGETPIKTSSKLDEILQLIKILKLDVDVELIELLIRLDII